MRRTSLRQKAITHRLPNKGTLEHGKKCDSKRAEHCPSACSFGSRALGVLSSACPLCGINNSTWFCGFHSKGEVPGRKKSKKAVFWWKASPGIQASLSLISALVSNSHKWDSLLTQQVRCLSIRIAGILRKTFKLRGELVVQASHSHDQGASQSIRSVVRRSK